MARELVLMADYGIDLTDDGQLPLWEGATLIENDSVDLPESLTTVMRAWNNSYEKVPLDASPDNAFIAVGRDIARKIQNHLGDGAIVYFFNDLTLQRENI